MRTGRRLSVRVLGPAVLLAFMMLAPGAGAEPFEEETPLRLSWDELRRLAEEHPVLAAGRFELAAVRDAVTAAKAVPNPGVEATTGRGTAIDGTSSRNEWGVTLSIPLGWLAERGPRVDAARAEERSAASEVEALRRDVLLQLRLMFWELAYQQRWVEVLEELDRQTRELVRLVSLRVEKGEARPVEAVRVVVEAETIGAELEASRAALASARDRLSAWVGVPPGRSLAVEADLEDLDPPIDLSGTRTRAHGHPSLLAAAARVDADVARVAEAKRAGFPSFGFAAFVDSELDRRGYGAGVQLEIPLWNWNLGNIRQARNRLAASRETLEARQRDLEARAVAFRAACEGGVTRSRHYRERILPNATRAAQTIERTYELGEVNILDVIDARRTLLATRRDYLEALVGAQADCSRLDALTGEDW